MEHKRLLAIKHSQRENQWDQRFVLPTPKKFLSPDPQLRCLLLTQNPQSKSSQSCRRKLQTIKNQPEKGTCLPKTYKELKIYINQQLSDLWQFKKIPKVHRFVFTNQLLKLPPSRVITEVLQEKQALLADHSPLHKAVRSLRARERCLKLAQAMIQSGVEVDQSVVNDLIDLTVLAAKNALKWISQLKELNPARKFHMNWDGHSDYLRKLVTDSNRICRLLNLQINNPFMIGHSACTRQKQAAIEAVKCQLQSYFKENS